MIAPCVCGGLRLLPVASRLTGCQLRRAEAATAKTTRPGSGPSGRPNRSPRSHPANGPQMTLGPTFRSTSRSFLPAAPPEILSNAWTADIFCLGQSFLIPRQAIIFQRLPSRGGEMPY